MVIFLLFSLQLLALSTKCIFKMLSMLQGSNLLFNCCVTALFRLSWVLVLIIRKMACHQSHPTALKEVRPKRALLRSYPAMWGTLQPYPAFLLLLHDGRNGIEVLDQFISCADASTRTNLFSYFCCKHRWCISWCISITFSQCICSRDGAWWLHKEMLWGDSHQHCTKRPKCATSDLDALQETSMGWYKKMRANILSICPSGVMKEALQNKMSCWIRVGSAGPTWEGLETHICILASLPAPPSAWFRHQASSSSSLLLTRAVQRRKSCDEHEIGPIELAAAVQAQHTLGQRRFTGAKSFARRRPI